MVDDGFKKQYVRLVIRSVKTELNWLGASQATERPTLRVI
jgi:hypothetical protein